MIDDKNTAEGRVLTLPGCGDVMTWADFSGNLERIGARWGETGQVIPSEKDRCPLCGGSFTLKDVRHGTIEDKCMNAPLHGYFHSDCGAVCEEIRRIRRQKR
jgi:hypothetical protein